MYTILCLFLRPPAAAYMPATRLSRVSQWTVFCYRGNVGRCARASDIPAGKVNFLPYRPASVASATGLWHCDTSLHTRYSSVHKAPCRSMAVPVQVTNDVPHDHFATDSSTSRQWRALSKRCRWSDFDGEACVVSFKLQIFASVRISWGLWTFSPSTLTRAANVSLIIRIAWKISRAEIVGFVDSYAALKSSWVPTFRKLQLVPST